MDNSDINLFFNNKNTITNSDEGDIQIDYLSMVNAFSRITYETVYIIDYATKGFEYVSENPLFLCGNTAAEVKEMGYDFYFKYVKKEDLEILLKINEEGFNFFEKIPISERLHYTISYDFHIKNALNKFVLINHKLTPIILKNGKIWKAFCIVSLSSKHDAGNVKIQNKKGDTWFLNLNNSSWERQEKIQLNDREKQIIHYSGQGYTVQDIAEKIHLSADTIKFHRKKLFEKLEVSSISEAIAMVMEYKMV